MADNVHIAKVDKEMRIYDDWGKPALLWLDWMSKMDIKTGDTGTLVFIKDGVKPDWHEEIHKEIMKHTTYDKAHQQVVGEIEMVCPHLLALNDLIF